MQAKIKKQQLMNIINQTDQIQKISKPALQQLCKVFKVQNFNTENSGLIKQLKSKILDIFLQQGEGYEDYLHLPRFKNLPLELSSKMFDIFKYIWTEYQKLKLQQNSINTKRIIQEITPKFSSLDDVQAFHLKLFQLYKSSDLCPKQMIQTKIHQQERIQPKPVPKSEINNFLFAPDPRSMNASKSQTLIPQMNNHPLPGMISLGGIPQPMYSMFPFTTPMNYPKIQANDNLSYIIQNKNGSNNNPNLFDFQRYGLNPHMNPYFPNNQPMNFYQNPQKMIKQSNSQPVSQTKEKNRSPFSLDISFSASQFNNYKFIQCPCQGTLNIENKKKFKCIQCDFQYHYACIKLPNINEQNFANNVCPLCVLKKSTIYCRVQKEPIKFNWYLNQKGKQLKVEMTQDQSNLVYEGQKNGYTCQIRFLKIDGNSLRKDKKSMIQSGKHYSFFNKIPKYTEITLPELKDKTRQPICLGIQLKSDDQVAQYKNPKLYLFSVFLMKTRKMQDVINDVFSGDSYTDLSYYNEAFTSGNSVQVSLQGQQFARGQIKYPVRGLNCKHLDVFDMKNFLGFIQDLKNESEQFNCPIQGCNCVFTEFLFDKLIYQAITNFPEYLHKQPEGIQIQRTGQYSWIGQQDSQIYEQGNEIDGDINELDKNSQDDDFDHQMHDNQI